MEESPPYPPCTNSDPLSDVPVTSISAVSSEGLDQQLQTEDRNSNICDVSEKVHADDFSLQVQSADVKLDQFNLVENISVNCAATSPASTELHCDSVPSPSQIHSEERLHLSCDIDTVSTVGTAISFPSVSIQSETSEECHLLDGVCLPDQNECTKAEDSANTNEYLTEDKQVVDSPEAPIETMDTEEYTE